MFPYFELFDWFLIYSFWLSITISFFLFIWMLKKLSIRFWYDFILFQKNVLWYFISIFFFSRLFYVIWRWNDLKHIENPLEFFVMNDYNFSLAWAIFWFFLVFYITSRIRKENLDKFVDWILVSFLFILSIWFIWALLWWQVYWTVTNYWIEILYSNDSLVPYQVPLFPLPIIYSIVFFILFSVFYILSMYVSQRSVLGYVWFILFSTTIFSLEFMSWKIDIFKELIWINLMQLFSIYLAFYAWYRLYLIYTDKEKKSIIL